MGFLVAVAVVSVGLMVVQASIANTFASKVSEYENVDLQNIARRALSNLLDWSGQPRTWVDEPNASRVQWVGLAVPGTHQTVDLEKVWHAFKLRETDNDFTAVLNRTMGLPDGMKWRFEMEPVYRVEENLTVESLHEYRVAYIGQFTGNDHPDYTKETAESKNDRYEIERAGVGFTNWLATFEPGANWSKGDVYPADPDALAPHLALRLAGFPFADDGQPQLDVSPPRENSYWNVIPASEVRGRNLNVDPLPEYVLSVANIDSDTGNWHTQSSGTDRVIMGPFDFTLAKNARVHLTHHVQTAMGAPTPRASIEYYCVAFCDGGPNREWTRVHDDAQWASRGTPQPGSAYWVEDGFRMDDVKGRIVYLALTFNHDNTANGQPGWLVQNVSVMEERGYSGWSTVYENRLDYKTREYDALVVGTEVEHNKLNDEGEVDDVRWHGAFKQALRSWNTAGGDIVIFGSPTTDVDARWIQTIWSDVAVAEYVAPERPITVLQGHALLSNPHAVDLSRVAPMQHLLVVGENAGGEHVVTVQHGGEHIVILAWTSVAEDQNGTVLLNPWAPKSLTGEQDRVRKWLVNTLASVAFQHYFMSAGAEVPSGVPVASETRVVLVDGAWQGIPYNTARVTLWVWR